MRKIFLPFSHSLPKSPSLLFARRRRIRARAWNSTARAKRLCWSRMGRTSCA